VRRLALAVALASLLGGIEGPLRADDRLYERSSWEPTGSQRGAKQVLDRKAPAAAPAAVASPAPAADVPPVPDPFERSPAFEVPRAPRRAWTSGERPPG
jgi:hypothetical protein